MATFLLTAVVLLGVAIGAVAALEVAVTHEYSVHDNELTDVVYDGQHDVVWSLDKGLGEATATLAGYDPAAEEVVVTEEFDDGHALALGDGVVYVGDGHTLWEYDVESQERTKVTQLEDHAGGLAYDAERDLVWVAGGGKGNVVAYDATDGEEVRRHEEHAPNGLQDVSVEGDTLATVATWEPDVVVYDLARDEVAFEPLPDSIADDEDGNLVSVEVTESGDVIVGGGWDTVFVYDGETQELRTTYAAHSWGVAAVDYHESADLIVSGGTGGRLAVFDVGADAVVQTHEHGETIAAALDGGTDVVWYGAGEHSHAVTGLELRFDDPAAGDDGTDGTDGDGTDGTDGDGTDGADGAGDDAGTSGGDGAGFGIAAVVIAVSSLALIGYRRRC